ncbi:arylamine N-acetyltransferase [Erwinia sp. P6884]|uniref:arylamine N-acetyltransferase family protein n=1 Tax=Erwinia sp. P6884 TaxID=3141450 RepID=UPI00319D6FFB
MNKTSEALDPGLTESVLEKLGMTTGPALSEAGLASLYQAWCQSVPFDNIRKRIASPAHAAQPLPGATPEDFFSHWLAFGTGGTCWASHGALRALLKQLGFSIRYGISTMLSQRPVSGDSPGHGTLVVRVDETTFVIDATMLHGVPLPLAEQQHEHPVWGTHVHHSEGHWCINWKPLGRPALDCRLLDFDAPWCEYARRHEASRHNSRFDGALLIRRAGQESITGIVKGKCVTRHLDGSETFSALTHKAQQKLLIEHFGIAEEIVVRLPEA